MRTRTRIRAGQSGGYPGGIAGKVWNPSEGYFEEPVSYAPQAPQQRPPVIPFGQMMPAPAPPPYMGEPGLDIRREPRTTTSFSLESMTDEELDKVPTDQLVAGYAREYSDKIHRAVVRRNQQRQLSLAERSKLPGSMTPTPGGGLAPSSVVDQQYGMKLLTRPPGEAGAAQQAGAGGAAPPWRAEFMRTGGTPGKYSKADVAREAALTGRQQGQFSAIAQARDRLANDTIQQSHGWMMAAAQEERAAGAEAGQARQEYLQAAQSVQRSRRDLDKMQIDPERYWRTMPEGQKVLSVIGLMFGGLAEGLSGGRVKNAAMQMLLAAQNRDIEAQRSNMSKLLQQVQMSERDRDMLAKRWDAAESQRRATGLRVMQLQLSRAGLLEQRLGIKEKYAGIVNALDQHMLDVLRESRGRGGGKVLTPESELARQKELMRYGAELKQEELLARASSRKGAEETRGTAALEQLEKRLPRMEKDYQSKWSVLGKFDPTGAGQRYERNKTRLSIALWRLYDSGKLSDADMKIAATTFFPDTIWGLDPSGVLKAAHGKAFGDLRQFLKENVKEAGTYQNRGIYREAYEKAGLPTRPMSMPEED